VSASINKNPTCTTWGGGGCRQPHRKNVANLKTSCPAQKCCSLGGIRFVPSWVHFPLCYAWALRGPATGVQSPRRVSHPRVHDGHPPSLVRVPAVQVPLCQRYYGDVRLPASLSPHFVILRLAIPCVAPVVSLLSAQGTRPQARGCVIRSPLPDMDAWRRSGPPKFLGNPHVSTPCSQTPAESVTSSHNNAPTRPPLFKRRRLPATINISGLNGTASTRAVYASPAASLQRTQDSLPAVGQTLRDGIGYPQGSYERFP
jgi:hypothetical protein